MLRIFANQQRNTAALLRSCFPPVASKKLCNTRTNPRGCRRNMSGNCPPKVTAPQFTSTGHYHIWSLTSNEGDSLMVLLPETGSEESKAVVTFSGSYANKSNAIDVINSTELPLPTNSFLLDHAGKKYILSVRTDDQLIIEAKPLPSKLSDNERFISHRHGSYSMFESKVHRNWFLASSKEGTLHIIQAHDTRHPDPRALMLLHSKQAISPTP